MQSYFSFFPKHRYHTLILICMVTAFLWAFRFNLGYDWGPYAVQKRDTLSGIMERALGGNTFLAYAAINNIRDDVKVNTIWMNTKARVQDGDVIELKGNTFVLSKPNGTTMSAQLFPVKSYAKRRVQALTFNIFLTFLLLVGVVMVIDHARRMFRRKIFTQPVARIASNAVYITTSVWWGLFFTVCVSIIELLFIHALSSFFFSLFIPLTIMNGIVVYKIFELFGKRYVVSGNSLSIIMTCSILFALGAAIVYISFIAVTPYLS